jgi:hypothetical protein
LFGGRIHDAIPDGHLELARDDILADLRIPPPGLSEIYRRTKKLSGRNCAEVERQRATIGIALSLMAVITLGLDGPAAVLRDEVGFIRLKVPDPAA